MNINTVRETWEAVSLLYVEGKPVTCEAVAKKLGLQSTAAWERVQELAETGYVVLGDEGQSGAIVPTVLLLPGRRQ